MPVSVSSLRLALITDVPLGEEVVLSMLGEIPLSNILQRLLHNLMAWPANNVKDVAPQKTRWFIAICYHLVS